MEEKVLALASAAAEEFGLLIWDVEYIKEGGANYLTIFLHRDEGVSIDDCEKVSRIIDPKLDQLDLISESYNFCVSSAGLTRKLSKPWHFEKCKGQIVEVRLYSAQAGQKVFVGSLVSYQDGDITIEQDKIFRLIKAEDVALCRLYFEL